MRQETSNDVFCIILGILFTAVGGIIWTYYEGVQRSARAERDAKEAIRQLNEDVRKLDAQMKWMNDDRPEKWVKEVRSTRKSGTMPHVILLLDEDEPIQNGWGTVGSCWIKSKEVLK